MFVAMTLLGCWLGYGLNWVCERRAFVARDDVFGFASPATGYPPTSPPWQLWVFNASGYAEVSILAASKMEMRYARSLFPEANVSSSFAVFASRIDEKHEPRSRCG